MGSGNGHPEHPPQSAIRSLYWVSRGCGLCLPIPPEDSVSGRLRRARASGASLRPPPTPPRRAPVPTLRRALRPWAQPLPAWREARWSHPAALQASDLGRDRHGWSREVRLGLLQGAWARAATTDPSARSGAAAACREGLPWAFGAPAPPDPRFRASEWAH